MNTVVYTVKSGDSLSRIASQYGTTAGAIAKANGIANANVIRVGQRLTIQTAAGAGPSTFTVDAVGTSGGPSADLLKQLRDAAAQFDASVAALKKVNRAKLSPAMQSQFDALMASEPVTRATISNALGIAQSADNWIQRAATAINDVIFSFRGIGAIPQITAALAATIIAGVAGFCYVAKKIVDAQQINYQQEVFNSSIKAGATAAEASNNAKTAGTTPDGQKPGFFESLSSTAKYGAMGIGALLLITLIPKSGAGPSPGR